MAESTWPCGRPFHLVIACLGLSALFHICLFLLPLPVCQTAPHEEIFITLEPAREILEPQSEETPLASPPSPPESAQEPLQKKETSVNATTKTVLKKKRASRNPAQQSSKNTGEPTSAPLKAEPSGQMAPPRLAPGNSAPAYPPLARKRGQQGTVLVRCLINKDGQATETVLKESSGFRLLDEAALKAVKTWKFHPAMKNGKPAPDYLVVPVEFRLN